MLERLHITTLAHTIYKKCECCDRVRDIFFKLIVNDSLTGKMLFGDFDLCKNCGENFGDILKLDVSTEKVVTEFNFG